MVRSMEYMPLSSSLFQLLRTLIGISNPSDYIHFKHLQIYFYLISLFLIITNFYLEFQIYLIIVKFQLFFVSNEG